MDASEVRVRRRLPIAGAEDITIDHAAGKAYIAAQDRWSSKGGKQPPGIYVLDLTSDTALPEKMPSDLSGDFAGGVRGLSFFVGASGTRRLFLIHDRGDADYAVEILDVGGNELHHVRTVADPDHLISCNDLVALDGERFYVTNDHGSRQQLAQLLETFAALPWSNVVFFDGNRFHTVAKNIEQANGIALDHRRKRLYVASTRMRCIYQYAWDPDRPAAELTDRVSIDLDGCPDNLEWNEDATELWVAADPSFIILAVYAMHTPLLQTAPSRVFCLHFENGETPRVERVFDDETGQVISASSVAAVYGSGAARRLLIGAPFDDHFIECELLMAS